MHHFFIRPENILDDTTLLITGDDVNHITRSLRLKIGEQVTLSAGQGIDYLVELQEFKPTEVVCRLVEGSPSRGEPRIQVTLFQGLPKSDKFDLIVQKCTELGIYSIIPVEMSRTIVKLDDKKADKRVERWQKIAEEAAKQSGRGKIPVVGNLVSWKQLLNLMQIESFDLVLVPWEEAHENSLRQVLQRYHSAGQSVNDQIRRIAYVIGPEGGISEEEVQALMEVGAEPITLGPRILRTETAGFAVLTVLMYEFNEMEGCDRR